MPTLESHGSATIFQFPVGGRAGLQSRSTGRQIAPVAGPLGYAAASGESWYHAEAIEEANRAGTH